MTAVAIHLEASPLGQPLACFAERRVDKLRRGLQQERPLSDDAELLKRIRGGAREDFAELVRRHQSHVFAILYRYERDHHRLEDLAQDTFLKAWRSLDQFDGRAPFQHWLSKIAVHAALDHLRKQKRSQHEIGFPELGEDALDWLHNEDKQSDLEASQAREILDGAMAKLSAEDQLVLTLLEIEDRSVKEISALTGWTAVTVRVRALRARGRLKKALEGLEKK
ncbi:MAG TPA: sigma-70 family RNA polymerase sigma factor [Candidatus Angelobacter sp.]|nr:sigma-70 family RNA polymerase sigma factor [Candidatus Angelobacter sp.]